MKITQLLVSVLASTLTAAAWLAPGDISSGYCVIHRVPEWEQRKLFFDFTKEFYVTRNVSEAFKLYVADDYIQHNPFEGQGAAASEQYLAPIFEDPAIGVTVLRQGFDNGTGWIHTRIDGYASLPVAIVDIFRFNGSCVQEHWDVIEELPANATNPIALF